MRVVDRRRPGDDAVVVVRVAQRLDQRRAPAVGAAPQVPVAHWLAVECLDDPMRHGPGQVVRAEGEVQLGVIVPVEGRVVGRFVAGVRGRHGEAVAEQAARVPDHAGEAARGVEHEPPRPAFDRHANLEADRRVDRAPHPAVHGRSARGRDQYARLHRAVHIRQRVEIGASILGRAGRGGNHREGKAHRCQQGEIAHLGSPEAQAAWGESIGEPWPRGLAVVTRRVCPFRSAA